MNSKHCPFCGIVHHGSVQDTGKPAGFGEAADLSAIGSFADADALFSKLEKGNSDSDEFYAAWITNYVNWARSFDSDSTMHNFARMYREKASELLSVAEARFPNSDQIIQSKRLVKSNIMINAVPEPKKACFVATAVYGNAARPEVEVLRTWRDTVLARSTIGRHLIEKYYVYGPVLAALVRRNRAAKSLCRCILSIVVRLLSS